MIVRTAAQGATREDFEREIKYLHKLHDVLQQRGKETPAPAMVFQEADLSVRVARDIFSGEFEKAIVDDPGQYHRLESFFNRTAPELLERLESYDDKDEPLFEKYGVEDAIQSVLKRRVDLPSGGYLIIDYAEAMTVIDVNSGSFTGRGKGAKLEDTITRTNLEAADEVVSQLRLRDIGGIIVIDFIDMARGRNRDAVLKMLRKSLDEDRTKTYVVEISPLGLVEMTRQNVTDGVREIMTKPCPVCEGEGVVLSEETVAIEVDRWLRDLVADGSKAPAFLIRVNPKVAAILVGSHGVEGPIHEIEQETGRHFHFEGTEALPIDHFEVVLEGTPDEVEERALPFREGEEVLVHIEEPHMYNEDDAVAKLDGYVVSVSGAATLVGEKTLVRIEKVGRSAAEASLVNPPEGVVASSADGDAHRARPRTGGAAGAGAEGAGAAEAAGADGYRVLVLGLVRWWPRGLSPAALPDEARTARLVRHRRRHHPRAAARPLLRMPLRSAGRSGLLRGRRADPSCSASGLALGARRLLASRSAGGAPLRLVRRGSAAAAFSSRTCLILPGRVVTSRIEAGIAKKRKPSRLARSCTRSSPALPASATSPPVLEPASRRASPTSPPTTGTPETASAAAPKPSWTALPESRTPVPSTASLSTVSCTFSASQASTNRVSRMSASRATARPRSFGVSG